MAVSLSWNRFRYYGDLLLNCWIYFQRNNNRIIGKKKHKRCQWSLQLLLFSTFRENKIVQMTLDAAQCPARRNGTLLNSTRKLTNVETMAADVLDQFSAGQHNANTLNILVYAYLLPLWLYKVLLHLLPFDISFKGKFWDPQFRWVRRVLYIGWDL